MENKIAENKMGTAPLFKLIISMSIPTIFSMLVQALYNIVDSVYVSRIGEYALTAVSLAYPMQMVLISVAVGTGVGINSLVARKLGEKKNNEADSAATHGLLLSFLSGIVFIFIGIFFSEMFISLFTDDANILKGGTTYLKIVSVFSMGVFLSVAIEKITQATGKMIYAMIFQLIGAVFNIILDPIFIFGYFGIPKMGIAGAAIATVISQIASMLFSLYVIFFKKQDVKIVFKRFRPDFKIIKNIYAVGLPAIIMQCVGSVMVTCINGILSKFTETAVAVFGIYFKLQSFVFMPVFGLTQGIMPIMGYNYGAQNKQRLTKTIKIGTVIAVVIMFIGTIAFMIGAKELLMIFDASDEMIKIGIPALRIISLNFIMAALGIVFSTFFQAVGMGSQSLFISLLRQLVVLVPAAYLLSFISLSAIWWAFPISETFSFVLSIVIFISIYKKRIKHLGCEE